jgi:hypothetical protein
MSPQSAGIDPPIQPPAIMPIVVRVFLLTAELYTCW